MFHTSSPRPAAQKIRDSGECPRKTFDVWKGWAPVPVAVRMLLGVCALTGPLVSSSVEGCSRSSVSGRFQMGGVCRCADGSRWFEDSSQIARRLVVTVYPGGYGWSRPSRSAKSTGWTYRMMMFGKRARPQKTTRSSGENFCPPSNQRRAFLLLLLW